MSYKSTFIQIAEDCPATESIVPQAKGNSMPIHLIQYNLLSKEPYTYSHEELVFAVYVARQGISDVELAEKRDELWANLFQKGHPCLRASALTKRYGWGAHYNEEGKIALYGMETEAYQDFVQSDDVKLLRAMRSKRVKK